MGNAGAKGSKDEFTFEDDGAFARPAGAAVEAEDLTLVMANGTQMRPSRRRCASTCSG